MLSASTPFKIHDENEHVKFAPTAATGKKFGGLGTIQQSARSFVDSTPVKQNAPKTAVKSTRKALGDLSSSQVNIRGVNTPAASKTVFKVLETQAEHDENAHNRSTMKKPSNKIQIALAERPVKSSDLDWTDIVCSRQGIETDPYDIAVARASKHQLYMIPTCDDLHSWTDEIINDISISVNYNSMQEELASDALAAPSPLPCYDLPIDDLEPL